MTIAIQFTFFKDHIFRNFPHFFTDKKFKIEHGIDRLVIYFHVTRSPTVLVQIYIHIRSKKCSKSTRGVDNKIAEPSFSIQFSPYRKLNSFENSRIT